MAVEFPSFQDHDQRFKTLLREFLPEFFDLFFPEWGSRFDFEDVEWLESELFSDPPAGTRRSVDLLAKIPTRDESETEPDWISLIHIEVESTDSVEPLRRRMHRYYTHLRDAYELPVLPIAMYLRVGFDGIGIDEFRENYGRLDVLTFRYLYVGLPGLDAVQYLKKNDLGTALAALMKTRTDDAARLKAESASLVSQMQRDEYRKYLVMECVDTYLILNDQQQAEYDRLVFQTDEHTGAREMATTWLEKGMERGLVAGQRKTILVVLENRFGPLDESVIARVNDWPAGQLDELTKNILTANSLKDLGLQD